MPLSDLEIRNIESMVNKVISGNLCISEEFISKEEASMKFNLTKLPEESGELLRIVKVGDYDACPCSGVHVKSTSEIGVFAISSATFENGVVRIRFKISEHEIG
jgi:Ser-tRNA(Ala) deacylase AlaX